MLSIPLQVGKLWRTVVETGRLTQDSILEVVVGYDVDAVHFDDYFYPYPVAGEEYPDEETHQRYGAGRFDSKADWRRDDVNRLIQELSDGIKRAKPRVKLSVIPFGVSHFGVWRNQETDPTGSATTAGAQTYDNLYANTRTWIRNEWLGGYAPRRVPLTGLQETRSGVELEWKAAPPGDEAAYYVVYRFDGNDGNGVPDRCAFNDPRDILANIRRAAGEKTQSYVDGTARPDRRYAYYVTAVDRVHHESRPSNPRRAGTEQPAPRCTQSRRLLR